MTTGANTTLRVTGKGVLGAVSSAMRSPWSRIAISSVTKVKPSEAQNCGSCQAFTKLPKPTYFLAAISDQLCSDIHTICANG